MQDKKKTYFEVYDVEQDVFDTPTFHFAELRLHVEWQLEALHLCANVSEMNTASGSIKVGYLGPADLLQELRRSCLAQAHLSQISVECASLQSHAESVLWCVSASQ